MSESDALSLVISLIYDAALDSARWPAALEQTAVFLRSATATLGSLDALQSNATFNFSWGDDPAYTAMYVERYARLNPLILRVLRPNGRIANRSMPGSASELK